jgi:hypothetical protein
LYECADPTNGKVSLLAPKIIRKTPAHECIQGDGNEEEVIGVAEKGWKPFCKEAGGDDVEPTEVSCSLVSKEARQFNPKPQEKPPCQNREQPEEWKGSNSDFDKEGVEDLREGRIMRVKGDILRVWLGIKHRQEKELHETMV